MAVTAPVGLQKIKTEFNGPDNLAAYVRGGTYVPDISANSAISTTVNGLAIGQFLNATNISVSLPSDWNPSTNDINIGASYICTTCEFTTPAALIELSVNSDGTMTAKDIYDDDGCPATGSAFSTLNHTWLQAGDASSLYIRLEGTGDSPSGAALSTNLVLSSNRVWTLCADAAFGNSVSLNFVGTLSIRDASNNILVSKTIQLSAVSANSD